MKEKEPPPPNLDFQMDPEEEEMYFQVRRSGFTAAAVGGCGWGGVGGWLDAKHPEAPLARRDVLERPGRGGRHARRFRRPQRSRAWEGTQGVALHAGILVPDLQQIIMYGVVNGRPPAFGARSTPDRMLEHYQAQSQRHAQARTGIPV